MGEMPKSLSESFDQMRRAHREEEKANPDILKKWERAAPAAVNLGVSLKTGSHIAGQAAGTATKVALDANPKLKSETASFARDAVVVNAAHLAGGVLALFLPFVIIHDAIVSKEDRWIK
jgi:hypothetical protein